MKLHPTLLISFLILNFSFFTSCNTPTPHETEEEKVLAFPQAEGGGRYARGGNTGTVYYVTSLDDDLYSPAAGTLRHAVNQSVARIILFKVSGTIHLKGELKIKYGNLTIAGQSAPGDGICIAGYPVIVSANNVLIRFVRFRMGDTNGVEGDALSVNKTDNVMIDHCSFSWSTDECVSCYGNTNFTLQYCFISESLRNSVHLKGNHGYGGILGGTNATFHHNLLAHHDSRNPRFDHDYVNNTCHGPIDFVNNVVYNWGGNSAYGGEGNTTARLINFQNNYYKPGPATKSGVRSRLLNPTTKCGNCGGSIIPGKFFMDGNILFDNQAVTADNWQGVHPDESNKLSQCKADARHEMEGIKLQSAEQAYETVLTKAGASLSRDAVDERIANEVRNGSYTYKGSNGSTNGLIDSQNDVGGWPELKNYRGSEVSNFANNANAATNADTYKDTDQDGIPDAWEDAHGLDRLRYGDAKEHTLDEHYTNLEVYLNSIVEHLY